MSESRFEVEWQRTQERLTQRRKDAREDNDSEAAAEAQKELNELPEKKTKAKEEREKGEWRDLRQDAAEAGLHYAIGAYWREVLFTFGTLLLTMGLLLSGFSAQGPERWVSLIILAIIVYSLYVGAGSNPITELLRTRSR